MTDVALWFGGPEGALATPFDKTRRRANRGRRGDLKDRSPKIAGRWYPPGVAVTVATTTARWRQEAERKQVARLRLALLGWPAAADGGTGRAPPSSPRRPSLPELHLAARSRGPRRHRKTGRRSTSCTTSRPTQGQLAALEDTNAARNARAPRHQANAPERSSEGEGCRLGVEDRFCAVVSEAVGPFYNNSIPGLLDP